MWKPTFTAVEGATKNGSKVIKNLFLGALSLFQPNTIKLLISLSMRG